MAIKSKIPDSRIERWLARHNLKASKQSRRKAVKAIRQRANKRKDTVGRDSTINESVAPWQIIYGKRRVGGIITYAALDPADETKLLLVITLACHKIGGIDALYFDDDEVTFSGTIGSTTLTSTNDAAGLGASVEIQLNSGDCHQTALSDMITWSGGEWTADHRQRGCAHVGMRIAWSEEYYSEFPEISFDVRGKVISGNSIPTKGSYDNNAAACLYDYLKDLDYGASRNLGGIVLSIDDIETPYNICNAAVPTVYPGTDLKRYEVHGVWDSTNRPSDIIQEMLSAMRGVLSLDDNFLTAYAGFFKDPDMQVLDVSATSKYLSHADDSHLSIDDNQATICAWFKLDDLAAEYCILSKWTDTGSNREWRLTYNQTANVFRFRIRDPSLNYVNCDSTVVPQAGVWYFAVLKHSPSANTLSIQINDGDIDSVSHSGGVANKTGTFYVGRYGEPPYSNFLGEIGPVAKWQRLLSTDELTWLYNSGCPRLFVELWSSHKTSLDAWYQMDETSAGAAPVTRVDSGSYALDLTDTDNTPSTTATFVPWDVYTLHDIVGNDIRIDAGRERQDQFVRLRSEYVEQTEGYAEREVVADDPNVSVINWNYDRLIDEVALPCTIDWAMARRLLKWEQADTYRHVTVEATFRLKLWKYHVGETIALNITRYGWSNKPFQIMSSQLVFVHPGNSGVVPGVRLVLKEVGTEMYDWDEATDEGTFTPATEPTDVPKKKRRPEPITNLTLQSGDAVMRQQPDGSFLHRIKVTWTRSTSESVLHGGHTEVEFRETGAGDDEWEQVGKWGGRRKRCFITDVKVGDSYDVRVRVVNQEGKPSTWVTITAHEVGGKTTAPNDVSGLQVESYDGSQLTLVWTRATDSVAFYRVRRTTSSEAWADAVTIAEVADPRLATTVDLNTSYTFMVKAVDGFGNESDTEASVNFTTTPAAGQAMGVLGLTYAG